MATQCIKKPELLTATLTHNFRDTISESYLAIYDDIQTDPITAHILAASAGPHPLPVRNQIYAAQPLSGLFARNFTPAFASESRKAILWTVSYSQPESGEPPINPNGYPLLAAPVLNVEYIDSEYVVDKAKNIDALSHGDGKGGSRAAGTEGPIVNAAGKRPDEPIVDTQRNAVLVVQKNYASLAEIVDLNETYQRTTNSDTVEGFSARRLKYLVTESLGDQVENNIKYWPGVTRIEVKKTTDLTIDNVGYEYWDATATDWKRAKDADGDDMAEPINLKLDGDQGGDNTTTITYRHLEPVAYAGIVG